jgi:hypothetical protein
MLGSLLLFDARLKRPVPTTLIAVRQALQLCFAECWGMSPMSAMVGANVNFGLSGKSSLISNWDTGTSLRMASR